MTAVLWDSGAGTGSSDSVTSGACDLRGCDSAISVSQYVAAAVSVSDITTISSSINPTQCPNSILRVSVIVSPTVYSAPSLSVRRHSASHIVGVLFTVC